MLNPKTKSSRKFGLSRLFSIPLLRSFTTSVLKNEYIVHDDISNGRERNKVPAISFKRNDVAPVDFHYVTEFVNLAQIDIDRSLSRMVCCKCTDNCGNDHCDCSTKHNSIRCYNSEGRLSSAYSVDLPEIIFECNAGCSCNRKTCSNMVIQNGCKARLVLFRTKSRGWGMRTIEALERGTFLGVYSGELITVTDSYKRQDDTYLFNLAGNHVSDKENQNDQEDCAASSSGNIVVATDDEFPPSEQATEFGAPDNSEQQVNQTATNSDNQFVCDAKFYGNFTRFINHSCEPNVIGVRTFTVHQDHRFPYISFFTNRAIAANTELTLNYGDNYWLVKCQRDNVNCLCKTPSCRFTKKTLPETIKMYNKQKRANNKES